MTIFYKIRSRKTGLFSTGGEYPSWSKIGKIWPARGYMTSHFANLSPHGKKVYAQEEAEIVECEFTVKGTTSIEQYVAEAGQRKAVREAQAKARREAAARQRDEEEFARLAQRLGKV